MIIISQLWEFSTSQYYSGLPILVYELAILLELDGEVMRGLYFVLNFIPSILFIYYILQTRNQRIRNENYLNYYAYFWIVRILYSVLLFIFYNYLFQDLVLNSRYSAESILDMIDIFNLLISLFPVIIILNFQAPPLKKFRNLELISIVINRILVHIVMPYLAETFLRYPQEGGRSFSESIALVNYYLQFPTIIGLSLSIIRLFYLKQFLQIEDDHLHQDFDYLNSTNDILVSS